MPFLSTLAAHSRTYADWDFDSSYSADFGPFTLDAPVHKSPHWMIYDSQSAIRHFGSFVDCMVWLDEKLA